MSKDILNIVINFRVTEEMHTRLENYREKMDAKTPYSNVTTTGIIRQAIDCYLDEHEGAE